MCVGGFVEVGDEGVDDEGVTVEGVGEGGEVEGVPHCWGTEVGIKVVG